MKERQTCHNTDNDFLGMFKSIYLKQVCSLWLKKTPNFLLTPFLFSQCMLCVLYVSQIDRSLTWWQVSGCSLSVQKTYKKKKRKRPRPPNNHCLTTWGMDVLLIQGASFGMNWTLQTKATTSAASEKATQINRLPEPRQDPLTHPRTHTHPTEPHYWHHGSVFPQSWINAMIPQCFLVVEGCRCFIWHVWSGCDPKPQRSILITAWQDPTVAVERIRQFCGKQVNSSPSIC